MYFFFFFFKQKTAYEMQRGLVGSEMCIRDRYQRRVHGLTVNISITDEDKTNLTFWRQADSLADGHLPELLKHTENTSLDAVDGWARFDIQVPGFSTIVGSIGS
eukprot:TRINITY_DN9480_c0_g2_i1.p2 TRINITY_DN9480_c0_g2~~TRINITY_DN9480_c0_g2_i1.p2  ORF type:complete len:104 (+),score=42.20 TRINITY_DN9480_c0_g2_i1:132-443(+)